MNDHFLNQICSCIYQSLTCCLWIVPLISVLFPPRVENCYFASSVCTDSHAIVILLLHLIHVSILVERFILSDCIPILRSIVSKFRTKQKIALTCQKKPWFYTWQKKFLKIHSTYAILIYFFKLPTGSDAVGQTCQESLLRFLMSGASEVGLKLCRWMKRSVRWLVESNKWEENWWLVVQLNSERYVACILDGGFCCGIWSWMFSSQTSIRNWCVFRLNSLPISWQHLSPCFLAGSAVVSTALCCRTTRDLL